jgi:hypothetical protein
MNFCIKALAYINPMFFYYATIYGASKILEWIFDSGSIWQFIWNKVMDAFGERSETYMIWIINSYSYILYWSFGATLMLMEYLRKPKSLQKFKIQKDKEELKDTVKLKKVNLS